MTIPAPFPPDWTKAFTVEQLERLAIRTVDGGMSDSDALIAEGLVRRLWERKAEEAKHEQN